MEPNDMIPDNKQIKQAQDESDSEKPNDENLTKSSESKRAQPIDTQIQEQEKQDPQQNSDNIISLSTFMSGISHQQQLEDQLVQKLEKKDSRVNRCTYNDMPKGQNENVEKGYLYQQVFSCRTCYEEQVKDKLIGPIQSSDQLYDSAQKFKKMSKEDQNKFLEEIRNEDINSKYKIKPHGFCLGCMLTCHDLHEVNELYCKLEFRCDCGNSHMPESCQINNEKEYENTVNKYSRNYYDLYCHCNQPHNQELIDQQKVYMIQCFTCEDWFHNSHLNPVMPSNEIDEKYLLICRSCIKDKPSNFKDIIMRHQTYFYEPIQKYVHQINSENSDEPPILKKQKTSEENPEQSQKKISAQSTLEEIAKDLHPLDIDVIIDDAFLVELQEDEKPLFKGIYKMIEAMANLDDEEEELQKNLDGELVGSPSKGLENNEDAKGQQKSQNIMKPPGIGQSDLYEQYFTQMMSKTLQNIQVGQPSADAGTLRTGLQPSSGNMINSILSAQGPTKQISQEALPYIAQNIALFKQKFIGLLKEAEVSGKVITKERVDEFFKDLKNERGEQDEE